MKIPSPFVLIFGALIAATAGCHSTQVSVQEEQTIRAAAHDFTTALRDADQQRLQSVTTAANDAQSQRLAQAVAGDTLSGRQIQKKLTDRFRDAESPPAAVGSDAWIAKMEQTAGDGPILRDGDRVLLGPPGRDGSLYLRHTGTAWKVELIPTLVAESGGRPVVDDPVVEYRFNVTRSINEWMLKRMENNEFASARDYKKARSDFWLKYLTYAANGQDPHDKLESWLPPMPKDRAVADDR